MAHGSKTLTGAPADPGDGGAAALERGRRLFAAECRFVAGAATIEALPTAYLPEVAFAGRSNVGKSSLVNALTGRRTLAYVSQRPGRTQQVNFFELAGRLMLVDLPGYGFAAIGRAEQQRWSALIEAYLAGRATLARVCLLIDARLGPTSLDREAMGLLDAAAVSYQAVLTKADEVTPEALASLTAALAAELSRHAAAHPDIAVTSAKTGAGVPALRAAVAALAAPVALV